MTAVYKAIAAVAKELAAQGISKDSRNQQQGFNFRGIDAVYNALAPLLAKHGLCILPRCIQRECVERTNKNGTVLFYVTVQAEFDFVSAEDGSKHTVSTFGEAMDSGDKATNKAMSAAYKYAAFQSFCIPTEETAVDADGETHTVRPAFDKAKIIAAFENSKTLAELKAHSEAAAAIVPDEEFAEIGRAYAKRKKEIEASLKESGQ